MAAVEPPPAAAVVELRQYTLHPGQRNVLVELFERALVESQEAVGARVLGTFTDRDRPDRFVWLRGFAGMPARRSALQDFYGGPVWAAHRDVANATMIDSDDVLLLRPLPVGAAWPAAAPRPPVGAAAPGSSVVVTVHRFPQPPPAAVLDLLTGPVERALTAAGSERVALLQTEPAANDFPALPVREGEHVVVRVARFPDPDARAGAAERLAASASWAALTAELAGYLTGPSTELHLRPTGRSLLR
jgi:hypothetical protein